MGGAAAWAGLGLFFIGMRQIGSHLHLADGQHWNLDAPELFPFFEAAADLGAAILVAIFGILAVLVLEFGKFKTALVVAGVIPLGLFGAVAALWLTGNSLSFTATIGLIALIGIEVKNSILLVDFTEQLRRQGVGLRETIERAGEVRFLPVLLTSVTAIFGLLPLALERSGLYSPLAIAIMGGLVTSTFLSRVATPVTYWLLSRGERDEATA